MGWEALTLSFIGSLALLVTIVEDFPNPVSIIVYRLSALMLIIMAVWTVNGCAGIRCSDKDLSISTHNCCYIVFSWQRVIKNVS
jgi:hypothetical protein